jgi:hypothetical protein
MKIKRWFLAGIVGVAVVSGVLEALMSPRKKEETGETKQDEKKEKARQGDNCDGLQHREDRRHLRFR